MKSLVYRMLRKPTTFADCIDIVRRHEVACAVIELERADRVTDQGPGTELVACVSMATEDGWSQARVVCGSYRQIHPDALCVDTVRKANDNLSGFVDELESLDVVVEAGDRKFDDIAGLPRRNGKPHRAAAPGPYRRFRDSELILRDELAVDRTVLANERTLLAYGRTALALSLTGAGGIELFPQTEMIVLGSALIGLGAAIAVLGVWRFSQMRASMSHIDRGA